MSISDRFRVDCGYDYELARIVASGDDLALLRFYHYHKNNKDEYLQALVATKGITLVPIAERDAGFMEAYLIIKNAFAALPEKARREEHVQAISAARGKRR